jgi:hypothetical protein
MRLAPEWRAQFCSASWVYPVDASALVLGQLAGAVQRVYFDVHAGALGDLARLPFERRDESEIVQHGRTQRQGNASHCFHRALGQRGHGFQP